MLGQGDKIIYPNIYLDSNLGSTFTKYQHNEIFDK